MNQFIDLLRGNPQFLVLGAIFLSVSILTFAIASFTRDWSKVRHRIGVAGTGAQDGEFRAGSITILDDAGTGGMLDGLLPKNETEKTELRRLLNGAGFYGKAAPVLFQLSRILMALLVGLVTAFNYSRLYPDHPYYFGVGASLFLTLAGYLFPKTIVSMRRDRLIEEHRQGFPDFLDLLVICIEAGVGIDSAVERVSRDMTMTFPSLARNLNFMCLEMRAGRATRDALENLAMRLGISEAKSFATLIQQSEELGSSLVQSLRVYSDEMREKRLSRAEEKAYALPAKLVIPLGLFIFPVILAIVLTPVVIKIYAALGI